MAALKVTDPVLRERKAATRAAIYRSLRALRAQNRKKVSKRVFLGVPKKVPENTPESQKGAQKVNFQSFWALFGLSGVFSGTFFGTPKKTRLETFLRFWARRARRLLQMVARVANEKP